MTGIGEYIRECLVADVAGSISSTRVEMLVRLAILKTWPNLAGLGLGARKWLLLPRQASVA